MATNFNNPCRHLIGGALSIKGQRVIDGLTNIRTPGTIEAQQLDGPFSGSANLGMISAPMESPGGTILLTGNVLSNQTITVDNMVIQNANLTGSFCLGSPLVPFNICSDLIPLAATSLGIGQNTLAELVSTETFVSNLNPSLLDGNIYLNGSVEPSYANNTSINTTKNITTNKIIANCLTGNIQVGGSFDGSGSGGVDLGSPTNRFTNLFTRNVISNCTTGTKFNVQTTVMTNHAHVSQSATILQKFDIGGNLSVLGKVTFINSSDGHLNQTKVFNDLQVHGNVTSCDPSGGGGGGGGASFDVCGVDLIKSNSLVANSLVTNLLITSDFDQFGFELIQNKGNVNGYCELNANAQIPILRIPENVLILQGCWDAENNVPDLANVSNAREGDYYIVSNSGTTPLDGQSQWDVGDTLLFGKGRWNKIDNNDAVPAVHGMTGNVDLSTDNVVESGNLYFTDAKVTSNPIITDLLSYKNQVGRSKVFYQVPILVPGVEPPVSSPGVPVKLAFFGGEEVLWSYEPSGVGLVFTNFGDIATDMRVFNSGVYSVSLNMQIRFNSNITQNVYFMVKPLVNDVPVVNLTGNCEIQIATECDAGNTTNVFESFTQIFDLEQADQLSWQITPTLSGNLDLFEIRNTEMIVRRLNGDGIF